MRRLRFAVLIVSAVAAGSLCAFALWSGLTSGGVARSAGHFVVTVAEQVSGSATSAPAPAPAPEQTASPTPATTLSAQSAAPHASLRLTRSAVKPVQTGAIVVRFRANNASTRALVAAKGGRIMQNSKGWLVASLPTPQGSTPDQYQAALAKRSDVLTASADELNKIQPVGYVTPTDWIFAGPVTAENWWQYAVNAPAAWQKGFGSATTPLRANASAFKVAVIDSGIYRGHPEMANSLVGKDEFQSCSEETGVYTTDMDITPYSGNYAIDAPWHGTAVSGTIGSAVNGTGTVGVGYDVIPVGYKIVGPYTRHGVVVDSGWSTQAAASAIYDATNDGCKVINMSWGGAGGPDPMLIDAENYAHSKGVLLVAAAGNDATSAPFYPADDPHVLSVSAITTSGVPSSPYTFASWSSYGSSVALSAPGEDMVLPVYDPSYGYWYMWLDGTSFSAPTVSGAAAFLWRAAPALDVGQITSLLESSAVDLGTPGRDDQYGYGMLDMNAAYNSLISQYPLLSAPATLTAQAEAGTHSVTATWSPVGGTSVAYSVMLDGASVGMTSATSYTIDGVATGAHAVAVQPTSVYNWWTTASQASANVSVDTTSPLTSSVTLTAPATSIAYPAKSLSVTGDTNARSSHITVQSSLDGLTWSSTGAGWTNSSAPTPTSVSVPVTRNCYLRLALTAPGWTDAVSNVIAVRYAAALKTPSAASSVKHSKRFTATETILAPARVSASAVTFLFYRQAKSGSKTWVLKKSVRAAGYSGSGESTTYRASLSLPKAGAYRVYASFTGGGRYVASKSAARALRVK